MDTSVSARRLVQRILAALPIPTILVTIRCAEGPRGVRRAREGAKSEMSTNYSQQAAEKAGPPRRKPFDRHDRVRQSTPIGSESPLSLYVACVALWPVPR
jgi:hypothetical protein